MKAKQLKLETKQETESKERDSTVTLPGPAAHWEQTSYRTKIENRFTLQTAEKKKLNQTKFVFPVQNPEKSHTLIGCCPVQFITIRTAHVSMTILSRFCPQIELQTSYNYKEHLVEVFKMNAYFHVQSVTGV